MLDFAAGNQPLPANLRIGQVVDAEFVYFDGAPPLRVLLKQRFEGLPSSHTLPSPTDVASLQRRFAELLAENPFLERWPVVLGPVTFAHRAERGEFTDANWPKGCRESLLQARLAGRSRSAAGER